MDKQRLWMKLKRIKRDLRMISLSIRDDNPGLEDHILKAQHDLELAMEILKTEIEG